MHCNPAPPHPPPGEVYNAICWGPPHIKGVSAGYVSLAVLVMALFIIYWIQWRYGSMNL